jgi:hypothetical protein
LNFEADVKKLSRGKLAGIFLFIILTGSLADIVIPHSSFSLTDCGLTVAGFTVLTGIFMLQKIPKRWGLDFGILTVGLVFSILSILSTGTGMQLFRYDFHSSDFISGFIQYLFIYWAMPLVAARYLRVDNLWLYMRALVVGYSIPLVAMPMSLLPHVPGFITTAFFQYGRARATYENPNSFGSICVVVLPVILTIAICDPSRKWRYIAIGATVLTLANMIMTVSFGAFGILASITIVNAALWLILKKHPMRKGWRRMLGITVFVVAVATGVIALASTKLPAGIKERMGVVISMVEKGDIRETKIGSVHIRTNLNKEAETFISQRQGGIYGHGLRQSPYMSRFNVNVHNEYLLLWIEGGIFLLLTFIVFFLILIRNCIALMRVSNMVGNAFALSLLAIIAFGFTNPEFYLRYWWVPLIPLFKNWSQATRYERKPEPAEGENEPSPALPLELSTTSP